MHISQMFKNRNKTWKRLEELGFDLSNCVAVGNRVIFGTITISYLEHTDHFSVAMRCPVCLERFSRFYRSHELRNGIELFSDHHCKPFSLLGEIARLIQNAISEE